MEVFDVGIQRPMGENDPAVADGGSDPGIADGRVNTPVYDGGPGSYGDNGPKVTLEGDE